MSAKSKAARAVDRRDREAASAWAEFLIRTLASDSTKHGDAAALANLRTNVERMLYYAVTHGRGLERRRIAARARRG